jgi:hypothetical protein
MIGIRRTAAAALALATAAFAAASAFAAPAPPKKVAFSASYAGRAVVRVSGDTAAITATGTGKGAVVGASKLTGTGTGLNAEPCPTFAGPGFITAADGSKLSFSVLQGAKSCPGATDPNQNVVSGSLVVKGGTGKFAKAAGSLTISGIYDKGKGTFTVKLAGPLTY